MGSESPTDVEKLTVFQLVLFVLSIVVLAALLVDTVTDVPQEVSKILQFLDTSVCALLLLDFFVRLAKAPDRVAFMKLGWIDLIASIPNVDFLRVGRLVRILKIIRLFRGIRAGQKLMRLVMEDKPKSAAASIVLATILLVSFSSVSILIAEAVPEANIKDAEDAVWWSVTTMTTVGYGDMYPVTAEGRVIAIILMFSGVGLFGTLSGLIASLFLNQSEANETKEIQGLKTKLEQIEEKLDALTKRQ